MKLALITSLLILLVSTNSIAQELNCQKFRNGKFEILKDSIAPGSILIRNENLQIETLKGRNDGLEFIVHWIDDCTYTLTPTEKTRKFYGDLPKDATLTVEIIETQANSYTQKSTSKFDGYVYVGKVYQIE